MMRRVFKLASAVSVGCLVVAVALWIDSFNRYYGAVYLPDHPRSVEVYAVRGAAAVSSVDGLVDGTGAEDPARLRCSVVDLQPDVVRVFDEFGFANGRFGELGFHFIRYSTPPTYNTTAEKQRIVVLPMWFAALVLAVLPAVSLRRGYVRRRRRAKGHCISCGYDLRASTDRCPECGTPIPAEAKA